MMEEIRECPCCGLPGELKDVHGKIRQGWVGCPACGLYIQWKIDPAGAIRKWNKRAGLTAEKALDIIELLGVLTPKELVALRREAAARK